MTVDLARLRALHATSSWAVSDSDDWRRLLPACFDELEAARAELDRLRADLVRVYAERDAAVKWIRTVGDDVNAAGDRDVILVTVRHLRSERDAARRERDAAPASPPSLRWRSAPPDVPGWWLLLDSTGVMAMSFDAMRVAAYSRWKNTAYVRWLGPIPEPEEEKP